MTWVQVLTIVLANFGLCVTLFLWVRKEANADRNELSSSISLGTSSLKNEMKEFREMWARETKDFHGRLCMIEERARK